MSFTTSIRRGLTSFTDLLFSHECPGCQRPCHPGRVFCPACVETIHPLGPPLCPRCFEPFSSGESRQCERCRTHPPAFRRAVSLFEYGGEMARAIQRLKYGQHIHLARNLGPLLAAHLRALRPDVVIPVPLHRSRLIQRGFNHAAELARWAGKGQTVPVKYGILRRVKDGPPQARAKLSERTALSPSAFAVSRPSHVADRIVALLDDVLTTGATASACATALCRAGARAVDVLTLCRSVR